MAIWNDRLVGNLRKLNTTLLYTKSSNHIEWPSCIESPIASHHMELHKFPNVLKYIYIPVLLYTVRRTKKIPSADNKLLT